MTRSWLDRLQCRLFTVRRRTRRAASVTPPARPRVEPLEGRVVPSTTTVMNTKDSGSGSLRAALNNIAPGDTIAFASGLTGTITLKSALPEITTNVTITGPGASQLTISGAGTYQIFNFGVGEDAFQITATITGLTFSDGNAGIGGAIVSAAVSLTIDNCVFSNNSAASGGAIYNSGDFQGGPIEPSLKLNHDTFINNTATSYGGAIDNDAGISWPLQISNSTFTGNSAHYGGAIANEEGQITATSSTFAGNSARGKLDSAGGAFINNHDPADSAHFI